MKKLISLLLAAVLLFSLTACSDKEEKEEETTTETEAVIETTEPVEETTAPTDEKEEEDEDFSAVTVIDNEYCKIEVTGLSEDLFGTVLNVTAENKTTDKNLFFATENCSINGVAVESVFSENVTAGNKAVSSISFLDDNLTENGITEYTDIEIAFRVYDGDDWTGDDLVKRSAHIYPYGEDKAERFTREAKSTDVPVFDNDEVSATIIGWGTDDVFGYCLSFFFENKSADTEYTFDISTLAVNGVETIPAAAFIIPAGKIGLEKCHITEGELTSYGITDFNDIFFTMSAFETDNWEAEDVAKQSIHVYPNGEENAIPFVREAKAADKIIADNDMITVIATGVTENELFDSQDLGFYFINKTDKELMFAIDGVSVNGIMMDPLFAINVHPGFSRFGEASWYGNELEEHGIDEITEIEFTMISRDANDWDAEDIISEKVVYNP
ncbi:MAG: hypothetical protein IKY78_01395 [Clostridia bacterium]|nr:hypothetical protein [Clostridia bacterium]